MNRNAPLYLLAARVFRLLEALSVLIILCGIPSIAAYLIMVWLRGPFAVAAVPLAVCLGLLGAHHGLLWLAARRGQPEGWDR